MKLHGILSAYLGDEEFDIGKTIHWHGHFCDTLFAMDLSQGDRTRSYLIDWANAFPEVQSAYYQNSPTFFEPGGSAEWRKTSFEKADAAWHYDADDWVAIVDCTEGLSIKESLDLLPSDPVVPPDPWPAPPPELAPVLTSTNIFWPWMENEIQAASGTQISLPVYAFIGNSPTWWVHGVYDSALQDTIDAMSDTEMLNGLTKAQLNVVNRFDTEQSYQSWTRAGWLPRLFKVSALRDPDFAWSSLDTFLASAPADAATAGTSLLTFGYARWTKNRRRVDHLTQRPLTVGDDDGFRVRQLLSIVKPVTGLPHDFWSSLDINGRTAAHPAPPSSVVAVNRAYSVDFSDSFANFEAVVPTAPGAAWGTWDVLQTGVYPEILRTAVPDYFMAGEIAPEPWNYFTGQSLLTIEQQIVFHSATPYIETRPPIPGQIPFPDALPREVEHDNPVSTTGTGVTP